MQKYIPHDNKQLYSTLFLQQKCMRRCNIFMHAKLPLKIHPMKPMNLQCHGENKISSSGIVWMFLYRKVVNKAGFGSTGVKPYVLFYQQLTDVNCTAIHLKSYSSLIQTYISDPEYHMPKNFDCGIWLLFLVPLQLVSVQYL